MLSPIPGPESYSDEWHALRVFDPDRKGQEVVFGASEAQKAVETPLELYLLKRGELDPPVQTEDMEVGLLMEPVVLEMYCRRTGNVIETDLPLYFHGEHSFMGATPDALGADSETPEEHRTWWGVDAKTSHDRMFIRHAVADSDVNKYGQEGTDMVPTYVLWQMQQQCAVMGFDHVDVPVLFGRKYRLYRVDRDETLIQAIIDAEKELAERIIDGRPPEPNWRHPNTRQCLQALHGLQKGSSIVLSDENYQRWLEITRRKEQIKELEALNQEDTNRVLAELGDAENGLFPLGEREIHRSVIAESIWTEADIESLRDKIGQVKRKGHMRLTERRAKS